MLQTVQSTEVLNSKPVKPAYVISASKNQPMSMLARSNRPREKLLAYGQAKLTNRELLQVVVGSGIAGADVTRIAEDLLLVMEQSHGKPDLNRLMQVRGVSLATASKLVASLELTARFNYTGSKIVDEDDVLTLLADIRHKKTEHFVVMTIDGAQRLIERRIISIGTLNASLVHPREVFADAISDRAAAIVVAHNHPGGTLQASGPDIVVTKRLRAAGELLGIQLLDHIIVTADSHCIVDV